jgi:hypothetical protein
VEKRCSVVRSDVTAVVGSVAIATWSAGAAANSSSEWIQPAATIVGQNVAYRLYREALQAGVIAGDVPGKWRWRHEFVPFCLASSELNGALK